MLTHDELLEIARDDRDAAEFLRSFQAKAHLVDDQEDGDVPTPIERVADVETDWLVTLSTNPFFTRNAAILVPTIVLGLNAWVDATRWSRSTKVEQRRAADVVKGYYHEVAYLVAFLVGGQGHMKEISNKYRSYDFEQEDK